MAKLAKFVPLTKMEEQSGHIYLIVNAQNLKAYIGQTVLSVARRFREHKYQAAAGSDMALHRAMRKHGLAAFTVRTIISCERSSLDSLEKHYIKQFGTLTRAGRGYNTTIGGGTWKWTDAQKAAMSKTKKGCKNPHEGKPRTAEAKAKIGAASAARIWTFEMQKNAAAAARKRCREPYRMTEEIRAQRRASMLSYWQRKKASANG